MDEHAYLMKSHGRRRSNDSGSLYTYQKKKNQPGYLSPAFLLYTQHTNTGGTPLRVDTPHSKAEKEADKFASTYSDGAPGTESDAQTNSDASSFTGNTGTTIHASDNEGGFALNQSQEQTVISAIAGSGAPLTEYQRKSFEQQTGRDLSSVRIHTGESAETAAASIHAKAFTVGKDIVFSKDQYRPGTKEGDHLLAHEVAHVAQGANSNHAAMVSRKEKQAKDKELTPAMIQSYWETFAKAAPNEMKAAHQILRAWHNEGYNVTNLYQETMALRGEKKGKKSPHRLPSSPKTNRFGEDMNQGIENSPVENQIAYLLNLRNPHIYETWCHVASMYIVLREAGANVEPNFVDFYVKHVKHIAGGKPEIYRSTAQVENNPEIVKEYKVEQVLLEHKRTPLQNLTKDDAYKKLADFLKTTDLHAVLFRPTFGHAVAIYKRDGKWFVMDVGSQDVNGTEFDPEKFAETIIFKYYRDPARPKYFDYYIHQG